MSSSRHLAAILFTDIVDFTAMMQKDEAIALTMVRRHNSVVSDCVKSHLGEVVNDYGDGCLSTFQSTTEATQCAIDIQNELRKQPSVPVRIGLHLGEVYSEGGKVMGDGVNVASRVQSMGIGNSILLSSAFHSNISNHPEFTVVSVGTFHFKNVNQPMEVFALTNEGLSVPKKAEMHGKLKEAKKPRLLTAALGISFLVIGVLIGIYYLSQQAKPATPREKESIAVLYFDNMSGDPNQVYFSDGMTEEIISKLSMIPGLRVTSRTSVRPYKEQNKSAREIGTDLGVKSILEGSVRKSGNHVKITAQLINTETDEHYWSESFESDVKDVLQLQSEIAQRIARKFRISISQKTKDRLLARSTTSPEAYDLYLQASQIQEDIVNVGYRRPHEVKAISLLKEAIQLDPTFSEAYASLGNRYLRLRPSAQSNADHDAIVDSARSAIERAIELNPESPGGNLTMAYLNAGLSNHPEALTWALKAHEFDPYEGTWMIVGMYKTLKDYKNAAAFLQKEIEIDPGNLANYVQKSSLYLHLGMIDSARTNLDKALRIAPTSTSILMSLSNFYRMTGQIDALIKLWPKVSHVYDSASANYALGVAFLLKRDWATADSLYRISSSPDDLDAGCIAIHRGRREEGIKFLKRAIDRRLNSRVKGFWESMDVARAYAVLGDKQYLKYGHDAFKDGEHSIIWLQVDPFFDSVRDTPEFKELEKLFIDRNEEYKRQVLEVFTPPVRIPELKR